MPQPLPAQAVEDLRHQAIRSKRSNVRLPIGFVRSANYAEKPPLATLLTMGESRLKLYLTLKMIATKAPYEMEALAPRAVAEMFNWNDPAGAGTARAQKAMRELERRGFISRTARPGQLSRVTILTPGADDDSNRWTSIPIEMWSYGWILALTGRGLAVYTALRELTGGRSGGAWMDGARKRTYGLADEVWRLGSKELEAHGILATWMDTKIEPRYRQIRRRKLYELDEGRIKLERPYSRIPESLSKVSTESL